MSQWSDWTGDFLCDDGFTRIKVVAHVRTPNAFDEHHAADSIVDDLYLINVQPEFGANATAANEKVRQLKTQFVGKPHSEWLKKVTANETT